MLYDSKLRNLANVTGTQIASYFGYSVASGDLNGDGRDDVIIGAPMWTDYRVVSKYETGRVYVVFQEVKGEEGNYGRTSIGILSSRSLMLPFCSTSS